MTLSARADLIRLGMALGQELLRCRPCAIRGVYGGMTVTGAREQDAALDLRCQPCAQK